MAASWAILYALLPKEGGRKAWPALEAKLEIKKNLPASLSFLSLCYARGSFSFLLLPSLPKIHREREIEREKSGREVEVGRVESKEEEEAKFRIYVLPFCFCWNFCFLPRPLSLPALQCGSSLLPSRPRKEEGGGGRRLASPSTFEMDPGKEKGRSGR